MRSMTGSGQATGANERFSMTVTMRGVNHRSLDVQIKVAEAYRAVEADVREVVAGELVRGRVEVRVDIAPLGERPATVSLRREVVMAVISAVRPLVAAGEVAGGLTAGDLLRIPGALEVEVEAAEWGDGERELTADMARRALAELVAARESEGARLAGILLARLDELERGVAKIDALRGPALAASHATLSKRIGELLGETTAIDPLRLAQEAAVLADRSDVSEEVDRLRAHAEHFREVATGASASGKRLDFLTQEIFRELNTLAAKCRHPEVVRLVLDAKVLCEQLREQVQNVE